MAGRPPKPAILRALSSSKPRPHTVSAEAIASTDAPPGALNLSDAAGRLWTEILSNLPHGLIETSDIFEFGRYVQLLADRNELREIIARKGRTIILRDEQGIPRSEKARPEVSMLHKVESELRLLGTLLGMTPSARERVSIPQVDANDDFEKKLFG